MAESKNQSMNKMGSCLKQAIIRIIRFLFPKQQWTRLTLLLGGCLLFKFLYFDFLWCLQTTFTSFSTPQCYINALLAVWLLLAPFACFRWGKVQLGILFLLDVLLVANLMYARTYYSDIPLGSYTSVGNLTDFGPSVWDSFRWYDGLLFLSTLLCLYSYYAGRSIGRKMQKRFILPYALVVLLTFLYAFSLVYERGGFQAAYSSLQGASKHTCTTPMYTVFGSLLYDVLQEKEIYTPEIKKQIETWMDGQPAYQALPDSVGNRCNLVIILAESLESWVLEKSVENKEITPYLNRLIQEPTTLYAPHVLTQVKGGRSIDAQLMLNAGMLPVSSGSYSIKYPYRTFYTLPKAMKEKYHTKSYLMTVDKKIVWNQNVVAQQFGIDSLLSKPCFHMEEKIGERGRQRLGDRPFLRQCAEKIAKGEIWKKGENAYLLCITYSGHNPFKLPEELKRIDFAGDYPERMKDYMVLANYTDKAIGDFVAFLRARPEYARTMIVITGDHEGLAEERASLCASEKGKGVVSDKPFTPFIVVHSPVGMRYDPVMGQVDMYPTLLNLMKLDNYRWKGIGQSILDAAKLPFAVGSQGNVEGELEKVPAADRARAEKAYAISDWMIRYDYWKKNNFIPFLRKE